MADVREKMSASDEVRGTVKCVALNVTRVLEGTYKLSDEQKAVLYHAMFENFEIDSDADYRKGEWLITKAYLSVPVLYRGEEVDSFVPGDGNGDSWVPDDSMYKGKHVENVCLLTRA